MVFPKEAVKLDEEAGRMEEGGDFTEQVDNQTASPFLARRHIYKNKKDSLDAKGNQLDNQLCKNGFRTESRTIMRILDQWRDSCPGYVWISDTLSTDMNFSLPAEVSIPDNTLQVFFVGKDLPCFVLTLQNNHEKNEPRTDSDREKIHPFTVATSKKLKYTLLDFCHAEFTVLPCTLDMQDLSVESLTRELKEMAVRRQQFYDGPITLDETVFNNVKQAAVLMSGASPVPVYISSAPLNLNNEEDMLILLDKPWRNVVHLLIECLTHADQRSLTVTCKADWKMKVAMLEAALRVGRRDQVTIQYSDTTIRECVRKLKDRKANFTLEPQAMDKMDCIVVQVITKASKISFAMKGGIATVTVGTEERSVSMETDEVDKSCVGSSLEHEKVTGGSMEDTREDKESDHRRSKTNEITAHVHQPPAEDYTHACKIIGLPETEEDLQEKVLELLDNIMGLKIHRDELVRVERTDIITGDEREVLVILKSEKARDKVVQHSWGLEKHCPGMFVEECLPLEKQDYLQKAREEYDYQNVRVRNGKINVDIHKEQLINMVSETSEEKTSAEWLQLCSGSPEFLFILTDSAGSQSIISTSCLSVYGSKQCKTFDHRAQQSVH